MGHSFNIYAYVRTRYFRYLGAFCGRDNKAKNLMDDDKIERLEKENRRLQERNDELEKTIHVLQDKVREMLTDLRKP